MRSFKPLLQRAETDRQTQGGTGRQEAPGRQWGIRHRGRCWQKSVKGQGGLLFSYASSHIHPTVPIYKYRLPRHVLRCNGLK